MGCDGAFFIEVVMGAHKIRETESTQVRKTSYDFATHEDWDPNNIENDICWIKLPETVELDANIQTVGLSSGSDPSKVKWLKLLDGEKTPIAQVDLVQSSEKLLFLL